MRNIFVIFWIMTVVIVSIYVYTDISVKAIKTSTEVSSEKSR